MHNLKEERFNLVHIFRRFSTWSAGSKAETWPKAAAGQNCLIQGSLKTERGEEWGTKMPPVTCFFPPDSTTKEHSQLWTHQWMNLLMTVAPSWPSHLHATLSDILNLNHNKYWNNWHVCALRKFPGPWWTKFSSPKSLIIGKCFPFFHFPFCSFHLKCNVTI